MKTNRKLTVLRLLVLGVLVAGFNAKPASAQIFYGQFTLPSATRWGLATLPAGEYSFTLDKGTNGDMVTVYRGRRPVALIMALGTSDPTSDRSELVLESGTVRKLSLPQHGMAFDYAAHNPRHRPAWEKRQVAQIIPVAAAGAGR